MRIATYSFRVDYATRYSEFNPLLLFAQKYAFAPNEPRTLRKCYASAVILVESGKGRIEIQGDIYNLQPGALVYIPAGSEHRWMTDSQKPMVQRCVYFDWMYVSRPDFQFQRDYFCSTKACLEELISPLPELDLQKVIHDCNIQLWVSYFNELTPPPEILGYRHPWDKLQYNGAFQTFLHHYVALASKSVIRDPRISRILSLMEQEALESCEPNLYQWASELGLQKSRFHALFKAETGFTPNDYMKKLKYHRIAEDLVCSNLSVTDISLKHGFSSIHYFSKAFRLATGLSPSDYRKKFSTTI